MIHSFFFRYFSLLLWWVAAFFYYFVYSYHLEWSNFLVAFITSFFILYGIYALVRNVFQESKSSINFLFLISFFLITLFSLIIFVFFLWKVWIAQGIIFYFKLLFSFLPIVFLWFTMYAFWLTLLKKNPFFYIENNYAQKLAALWLGFGVFMTGIFFLAMFWWYNSLGISIFTLIIFSLSYTSFPEIWKSFRNPILHYEHDMSESKGFFWSINPQRILDEVHVFLISFLLSINLVNVYRPFPIGWDDLWMYMNFPKLLAQAGELLPLGNMYIWQLYTGMGFAFWSQTSAFILNTFSGFLVAIVMYLAFSLFKKEKYKISYHLEFLLIIIILGLPMSIFQLAKDMKLDIGLLSLSIIPLSLIYSYFLEEKQHGKRYQWMYFGLVGFLIWICFSLKVTSLLLLIGILGAISYAHLSFFGFLWYTFLFLSSFTVLKLWGMMNVILPLDSPSFFWTFTLSTSLLSCVSFYIAFFEYKKEFRKSFQKNVLQIAAVILGFIIALMPWLGKNTYETVTMHASLNAISLLNGTPEPFVPDYTNIYTPQELENLEKTQNEWIEESGINKNEDFGRYFGYEEGLNNYLKLPWNLSFQVNQKGEFTDISFLFLAFIPGFFLFLKFKRKRFAYFIPLLWTFFLLYFIPGTSFSQDFTQLFSFITLPLGYVFLFVLYFWVFAYLHFTLDGTKKQNSEILFTASFLVTYVFLWLIAAFGVVWYGIVMYFWFLLFFYIILEQYKEHDYEKNTIFSPRNIFLLVVWIYIFTSIIPHGLSNLVNAGYYEYKTWAYTEEQMLMIHHPEYFSILFALNIAPEQREALFTEYRNNILWVLDDYPEAANIFPVVQATKNIFELQSILQYLQQNNLWELWLKILNIQQDMYQKVIYPFEESQKNTAKIYRIGTFLKYFINNNHTRILEDSLVTEFDKKIYNEDPSVTFERLKKLGIGYLLIDLNAATIDQDPTKRLTQRYDHLLSFMAHEKLNLIETDSICLKVAREDYAKDKNMEQFLKVAGVNYNGKDLSKDEKKLACLSRIETLIREWSVTGEQYSYLLVFKNFLDTQAKNIKTPEDAIKAINQYIPDGYKVLFEIPQQ